MIWDLRSCSRGYQVLCDGVPVTFPMMEDNTLAVGEDLQYAAQFVDTFDFDQANALVQMMRRESKRHG